MCLLQVILIVCCLQVDAVDNKTSDVLSMVKQIGSFLGISTESVASEELPSDVVQTLRQLIANGSTPSHAPVKIKSRTVKGLIWVAHPSKKESKSDGKQKSGYNRDMFDDNMTGVDRDCIMSARMVKDEVITIGFDNYGDLIRYIIRILDFSNENPACAMGH